MSENEVEKAQETGEKRVGGEQQPSALPAAKKPKVGKAAVSKQPAAAEGLREIEVTPDIKVISAIPRPEYPEKEIEHPKTAKKPTVKAEAGKKAAAIDGILAAIKKLTVLELSELVKALEAEFGVSAAALVAATTAAPAAAAAPAPAVEEKTEFSVILKDIGANKISVIRAVRELTTLGLKEAKDLVESAPQTVKEGISKDEATTVKQKLEAAGATVELK